MLKVFSPENWPNQLSFAISKSDNKLHIENSEIKSPQIRDCIQQNLAEILQNAEENALIQVNLKNQAKQYFASHSQEIIEENKILNTQKQIYQLILLQIPELSELIQAKQQTEKEHKIQQKIIETQQNIIEKEKKFSRFPHENPSPLSAFHKNGEIDICNPVFQEKFPQIKNFDELNLIHAGEPLNINFLQNFFQSPETVLDLEIFCPQNQEFYQARITQNEDFFNIYFNNISKIKELLNKLHSISAGIAHDIRNAILSASGFTNLSQEHNRQIIDRTQTLAQEIEDLKTIIKKPRIEDLVNIADLIQSDLQKISEIANQNHNFLKIIDRAITNTNNIVYQLKDYDRIEAGIFTPQLSDFNLMQICEDLKDFYQREIQENNIQVKIEYDKQLSHYLYGGGVYLQQILENLFKNAIRYGRPQDPSIIPEIKISVQKIQDIPLQVQIKVQDNGSGIKDKDKNQLFSFRHRSEDSKNYQGKEGSNGLGLAFARKVIEVLGGEINYISPKVGTCFYFNIPLQYSEKNLEKSNPILPLQNLNLVMVDDDKINHQLFSINLADRNQIQSFYQSENTLNHLIDRFYQKEEEIDAIILDKNIGEEDGLELARNIRMIGKTIQNFKCPALILYTGSSKNESPEIQTALEQEVIQEAIDKTANIAELSYAIYRQLSPIKQSQQYSQFSPEIQKYIQENPTLKTKEQNTPEAPPIKKLSIDPDLNHFDAHIINRSFSNQLYIIQNVYPIIHNLFNQNREYFAKLKEAILGKNLSQLSRVCHTFSPLLNNFGASALKHNIEQIRYFYEGKEQLSPVEWEEISKFCQNYNADYIQQFLQEFSKYISQIILERLNKINFIKDENEKDLKINSVVQFCAYNQLNITEALNNIGISGIDSFNISSYEQIKLLIKEIPKIDTDLLEKKLTEIFFSNLNN